ncbi:MAG TPA: rubrerythrin family protein [Dehalococcoidia bacterium]|nr:rubrerythrin family protein [Dehalococcoidia bacterium]
MSDLPSEVKRKVLEMQKGEITEHFIYEALSRATKDSGNKEILRRIASEERRHYDLWKRHTNEDIKPDRWLVWRYCFISRTLGLTFGLKLMERGEQKAEAAYDALAQYVPEAREIAREEDNHEKQLISLIDEERLQYIGAIVLGLNDALVELTGALSGFTLALQNTRLIAVVGLITGIAASMSMAGSEYLATKSEEDARSPLKSAVYTGFAYILTVMLLIFPYFIFSNVFFSFGLMIFIAISVIFHFTFYMSVVKEISFKHRFLEMAAVSLGIAALSFVIGFLIRTFLGVDI